jgi:hypothetical protein
VDNVGRIENDETVNQLLHKTTNQRQGEPAKLVLLRQLVKIDAQQLKHEAQVLSKDEVVRQAYNVRFVVGIKLVIQLCVGWNSRK